MEISHVVRGDIEQLKYIARDAVTTSVTIGEAESSALLQSIELDVERYFDCPHSFYFKAGFDSPVGYILVKEYWNLAHLFVSPEYQGRGVGGRLLASAMNACRANNEKGFMRVNSSLNAVGFYERHGFVRFKPDKPVPSFAVPMIYQF